MNDDTTHGGDFRGDGFPPEQAEQFFKNQLDAVICLCHLGTIWRMQWQHEPLAIPMEADIHG